MRHIRLIAIVLLCSQVSAIAQQTSIPTASSPVRSVGVAFGEIQGRAVDSDGAPLPRRKVRQRDVRTGRIIEGKLTDDRGVFTFRGVDPGSYVIELLDDTDKALAASDMLTINPGDTASTIVRLPTKVRSLGGMVGAAAVVVGTAAAAGVLALQVKDCVSPPCEN